MRLQTLSYRASNGFSCSPDSSLDSDSSLIIVFGAAREDLTAPLRELRVRFPSARMIGCSTAGQIYGTQISDEGAVVAIIRFERTKVRAAVTDVEPDGSLAAGQQIGRELRDPSLRAVFVLSDGTNVNGSALVRGICEIVGASVPVTGGLAADGDRFESTWVMHQGEAHAGRVAAVGLYGPHLRIRHGSKGGWDIFGMERRITRSSGNVLYELDDKPALDLYKKYLGDRADGLPATALLFPLAVRTSPESEGQLVRTVLSVNEAEHSMTFAGDMPTGALAQFMRANFDRLVQGASDAATMTLARGGPAAGPTLSIAISCIGRRLVLGQRAEEETEATFHALAADAEQIGFYSYGEISPVTEISCELHNQTMTLTTLSED